MCPLPLVSAVSRPHPLVSAACLALLASAPALLRLLEAEVQVAALTFGS